MNEKLKEYDKKIFQITNTLSYDIDLYEIIININECIDLYTTIGMELCNHSIPFLYEDLRPCEIEELQSRKQKVTTLLQKIAESIKNEIDKLFSKIFKEELKNPC